MMRMNYIKLLTLPVALICSANASMGIDSNSEVDSLETEEVEVLSHLLTGGMRSG